MADDDAIEYFRRWARREYLTKHEKQRRGRRRERKGRGEST
jgi:hypothetical protein